MTTFASLSLSLSPYWAFQSLGECKGDGGRVKAGEGTVSDERKRRPRPLPTQSTKGSPPFPSHPTPNSTLSLSLSASLCLSLSLNEQNE
jgi:hypothetical protein